MDILFVAVTNDDMVGDKILRINYKRFSKVVLVTIIISWASISLATGRPLINLDFLKKNLNLSTMLNPVAIPDKPVNILLLGTDNVATNTDVILFVTYDPKSKKGTAVSIPRDTRVEYEGRKRKINSVYSIGKEDMIKEVASEIIGQPIDYVTVVNTKGFRNLIDILGGVEVDVPMDMDYDDNYQDLHIHLKKGLQVLNGDKSEQFIRFRHGYKEGDLGRISANQIFFKALLAQKLQPEYILKAPQMLSEVFKDIKTDMPVDQAIGYVLSAKDLNQGNISFVTLPGTAKYISGKSYFIYDKDKINKLFNNSFTLSQENQ